MSTVLTDNIVQGDPAAASASAAADAAGDDYIRSFEAVDAQNDKIRELTASIARQGNQDDRLAVALKCLVEQQKLNDQLHNLMIEMNNIFAPK